MTYAETLALMATMGYVMVWSSADQQIAGFTRQHEGVTIAANVHVEAGNVEIYSVHNSLRITAGLFKLEPSLVDKHEAYVAKATHALCLCGV